MVGLVESGTGGAYGIIGSLRQPTVDSTQHAREAFVSASRSSAAPAAPADEAPGMYALLTPTEGAQTSSRSEAPALWGLGQQIDVLA